MYIVEMSRAVSRTIVPQIGRSRASSDQAQKEAKSLSASSTDVNDDYNLSLIP